MTEEVTHAQIYERLLAVETKVDDIDKNTKDLVSAIDAAKDAIQLRTFTAPLAGPPNSGTGNYPDTSLGASLSLRTSSGKTAPMQSELSKLFVSSIDGNTVNVPQFSPNLLGGYISNSISDSLSESTGWYFYPTMSTTTLTIRARKIVLS